METTKKIRTALTIANKFTERAMLAEQARSAISNIQCRYNFGVSEDDWKLLSEANRILIKMNRQSDIQEIEEYLKGLD